MKNDLYFFGLTKKSLCAWIISCPGAYIERGNSEFNMKMRIEARNGVQGPVFYDRLASEQRNQKRGVNTIVAKSVATLEFHRGLG